MPSKENELTRYYSLQSHIRFRGKGLGWWDLTEKVDSEEKSIIVKPNITPNITQGHWFLEFYVLAIEDFNERVKDVKLTGKNLSDTVIDLLVDSFFSDNYENRKRFQGLEVRFFFQKPGKKESGYLFRIL